MRHMAVRPLDLNGTLARASAAVFAVDGSGRITLWNRAAERLLGHSSREAIGRPSCAIIRSDSDGAPTLCYRGCHAGLVSVDGQMKNVDVRTRTRAGRLIDVNVSTLVIAGPKDRGPTVMHLLREATTPKYTAGVNGNGNGLVASERSDAAALTRREIDVLRLMGAGMNTRAIAGTLSLSAATVRNHVQSILGKLGVHSRLGAVAVAHRRALL
jgi:PAS domain S-box-containing protein